MEIIFFFVAGAVLIFFLSTRARMHTEKVLQSLAEKGLPIPAELLRKADTQDKRARYVAWGVILIAVGLATVVFFTAMVSVPSSLPGPMEPPLWLPFLAAFPLFSGMACLLIAWLQRPHD